MGQDRARADRPRRTVETVADEVQPRHSGAAVLEADADLGLGALTAAVGERAKIGRLRDGGLDVGRNDRDAGGAAGRASRRARGWSELYMMGVRGTLKTKNRIL